MEKIEQQKKLEKQKANLICAMIFLGLFIPTFLSMTSRFGISVPLQASFFVAILIVMMLLYFRMQRIEAKINSLVQVKSKANQAS